MTGGASAIAAGVLAGSAVIAVRGARRATAHERVRRRVRASAARVADPGRGLAPGLRCPAWLVERVERAGLEVDVHRAWTLWVAGALAGGGVALVLGGAVPAALVGVAAIAGPVAGPWALAGRGDARIEAQLPDCLEAVARSLRSGAALRPALAEAATTAGGRLAGDLRALTSRAAAGVPLEEALQEWRRDRDLPGVRLAVAALSLGIETGGAHARAIDGVAATLRDHAGLRAEVRALSSQARLSALVIGVAPVAFMAFTASADARVGHFLFGTPIGVAVLGAGLALDGLAAWWMSRLSRIEL